MHDLLVSYDEKVKLIIGNRRIICLVYQRSEITHSLLPAFFRYDGEHRPQPLGSNPQQCRWKYCCLPAIGLEVKAFEASRAKQRLKFIATGIDVQHERHELREYHPQIPAAAE